MFFKVSSLHVYTHQDTSTNQIENCKICDSAIENQTAEHLPTSLVFVEFTQKIEVETAPLSCYSKQFTYLKLHFRLFGRPPPAIG